MLRSEMRDRVAICHEPLRLVEVGALNATAQIVKRVDLQYPQRR
jgi:hypothetical protein